MITQITKKEKLLSVRNEWTAADYLLIHGRLYDNEKKYFYRFKFVLTIDLCCDLWDGENDIPYTEAVNDMIFSFVDCAGDDINDKNKLKMFYNMCNETIDKWNGKKG